MKCTQADGAYLNYWWLCSPGGNDREAACVDGGSGLVDDYGYDVGVTLGVRPALKLNLSSVIFSSESKTFHAHSFTYNASGATITATCAADGCPLPPSTEGGADHVATLTIAAPTLTTYGGTGSADATITDVYSIKGDASIQYQTKSGDTYGTATETAPIDAGMHKASITLGPEGKTATAYVEYEIAPMTLTIDTATATDRAS